MIKYKAKKSSYSFEKRIEQVEITRETDACVWFIDTWNKKERRANKVSDYECYFDTFKQAKQYCIDIAVRKIELATSQLTDAQNELKKANELTE